ncbi:MAG: TonB-dependent receptor plug domain-containing protein, partial [Rhodospirillaceae bacterium]|nr:TonB-dependent receptor plug domain-containing protein [Rhodospirillaceae bacterium]
QYNEQGIQAPGRIYTQIRFRGLGGEITEPFGQIGSAFLDGIYVSSGVSSLGTENIERIEIVKGPSSAWLGRSTFAGAVNMISKTPSTEEYSGRATASFAEDTTYDLSGAHQGPLVKGKLGYRVFVQSFGTDGQYRASDGGDLGRQRTDAFSGALFATPTEDLDLKLNALHARDNDGSTPAVLISGPLGRRGTNIGLTTCFAQNPGWRALFRRNIPAQGPLTDFVCGEVPVAPQLVDSNTALTPDFVRFWNQVLPKVKGVPFLDRVGNKRLQTRLSANLDYRLPFGGVLDGATFTVLGGYGRERVATVRDFDFTGIGNWYGRDPQVMTTKQAEARLTSGDDGPLDWMLGASWFKASFIAQYGSGEPIIGTDGGITLTAPFAANDLDVVLGRVTDLRCPCVLPPLDAPPRNSGETTGVFGSVGYDVTEQVSLQFEWRWQHDRISAQSVTIQTVSPLFAPFVVDTGGGQGLVLADSFDTFLPRVTVQFTPMEATNLWATYSKGNNPGFFNGGLLANSQDDVNRILALAPSSQLFVAEETLDNYELGWRQRWLDGRVNTSVVAYYMQWKNQKTRTQILFTRANGATGIASLVVGGFDTDLKGLEAEGSAALTDNLTIDGALNYAGAEFKNFECGFTNNYAPAEPDGRLVCDGGRPVMYPKWSGTLAATWTDALTANWNYFVRADGQYTGKRYVDEKNFAWIGDAAIFNLRLGVERENLRIEAFATNLFNNDQYLAGARFSDFSADQGTLFPLEFGNQQAVVMTPAKKRQLGLRLAVDF